MALFNELYFLVDGGSFWEHGEVGGPDPAPDDIGRFALLECVDYPFYDTVDVDFYASFAVLELFPELEIRGIRDLLEAIPVDDPEIVTIDASGARAPRKVGGTVPARRRRAGRRSVLPAELVPLPGRQRLEGPRPEVRPPGVARHRRRGRARRPAPAMRSPARSGRRSTTS